MRRNFRILSAIVVSLGVIAGSGRTPAASTSAEPGASLEGTVKKVNPTASTVEVTVGKFGLWAKTLEVSGDTDIRVDGRKANLEDLQEGEKIRASYETLVGKSFATSIEVMPEPMPREMTGHAGPKAGS